MRKIYFIIPYILILSCGKAPEPMTAVAENSPLEIPEEIGKQELKLNKLYDPTSNIFNFFFWPSNLDDETLRELSAEVSRIGIGVEKKFKQMDENNKYIDYDSKIEIENLKKEKEEKISDLFKRYPCIENETGDNCVEDNLSTLPTTFPKSCKELGSPPWNKPGSKKECADEKSEIEKNYKEKLKVIKKEVKDRGNKNTDLLNSMAEGESALCKLLGDDPEKPNNWVNWMRTEQTHAKIELVPNDLPQITLEIIFNKHLEGVENRRLKYTSTEPKEIRNIRYYLENQIPVLEFTLYEKMDTGPESEKETGRYYQMKLRQAELEFGLEFLGEVERFDEFGKSLGKGLMKIYFPREF